MAFVQTAYRERPSDWILGQIADTYRYDADTYIVDEAEGIPFAVGLRLQDDGGQKVLVGVRPNKFAGISVRDPGLDPADFDHYGFGRNVSCMNTGDIIVAPQSNVIAGMKATVTWNGLFDADKKTPAATAWAGAVAHSVGDLVSQSGQNYICIRAHTSTGTNNVDGSPTSSNQTGWAPYFGFFSIPGAVWMTKASGGELAKLRLGSGNLNVIGQ